MTSQEMFESMFPDAYKSRRPSHFKYAVYYPPYESMWEAWQNAHEKLSSLRIKRPPPKRGKNATPIQYIYQDAFDRGYAAGVAAYRQRIRKLTEQT